MSDNAVILKAIGDAGEQYRLRLSSNDSIRIVLEDIEITVNRDRLVVAKQDNGKPVQTEIVFSDLTFESLDDNLLTAVRSLKNVKSALEEAGIGEQPNPLNKHVD